MNLSSAGMDVNEGSYWDDAHPWKLTGAIYAVPTRLGYILLAMDALWHRLLLRHEIRKYHPSGLQSLLGVLLRSPGVSIEEDAVNLEHAMVRIVRSGQTLPLLQRDGGFETFWL